MVVERESEEMEEGREREEEREWVRVTAAVTSRRERLYWREGTDGRVRRER